MNYNKEWKNKSGIYFIKCTPTNKIYIGKSKNIYNRLKNHITCLNRNLSKHENQYLINAWNKYNEINFEIGVLEYCIYDELSNKELFYIRKFNSIDKNKGFNLRIDTEFGMIPSEETRIKMSISRNNWENNLTNQQKIDRQIKSSKKWKLYSKKQLNDIKDKLSNSRTIYKWYQYDLEMNLIKIWKSVRDILKQNPQYKRHNIYACASGEKPTMYGFIWKKYE